MSCVWAKLILESIRTWITSSQSIKVMAELELRWIEVDALCAWPAFEEFLAIIFFERQRNVRVTHPIASEQVTADEIILLESMIVARWDMEAATRYLRCFLNEASACAAAAAASRIREALLRAASSEASYGAATNQRARKD
jgi:hypothetical protein